MQQDVPPRPLPGQPGRGNLPNPRGGPPRGGPPRGGPPRGGPPRGGRGRGRAAGPAAGLVQMNGGAGAPSPPAPTSHQGDNEGARRSFNPADVPSVPGRRVSVPSAPTPTTPSKPVVDVTTSSAPNIPVVPSKPVAIPSRPTASPSKLPPKPVNRPPKPSARPNSSVGPPIPSGRPSSVLSQQLSQSYSKEQDLSGEQELSLETSSAPLDSQPESSPAVSPSSTPSASPVGSPTNHLNPPAGSPNPSLQLPKSVTTSSPQSSSVTTSSPRSVYSTLPQGSSAVTTSLPQGSSPRGSSVTTSSPRGSSVPSSSPRSSSVYSTLPQGSSVTVSSPRGSSVTTSSPRSASVYSPPQDQSSSSPRGPSNFKKTDTVCARNRAPAPRPPTHSPSATSLHSPATASAHSHAVTPRIQSAMGLLPESAIDFIEDDADIEEARGLNFNTNMMKSALDITLSRAEGEENAQDSPGNVRKFAQNRQSYSSRYGSTYQNRSSVMEKTSLKEKEKGFLTVSKRKARKSAMNEFVISSPSSFRKEETPDGATGGVNTPEQKKERKIDALEALKVGGQHGTPGRVRLGGGMDRGDMKMAQLALDELVTTERAYVLDMALLVTHYQTPCLSNSFLPKDQADSVFMNVVTLMELHTELVADFGDDPSLETVVASYQKSCPRLIKEYGFFASAYTKAIAVLESPKLSKEFVAFCNRSRQNPANKGLSLSDYLIKPIQRICKYPLLFRELLHHLTDDHPQAVTAKTVQIAMDVVTGRVNEARKQSELDLKLQTMEDTIEGLGDIQLLGAREYLTDSVFFVYGTTHRRQIYLVNDHILVTQKNKMQKDKLILKHALSLVDDSIHYDLLMAENPQKKRDPSASPSVEEDEEPQKSVLKISSLEELRYYFFEFTTEKDAKDWAGRFDKIYQDGNMKHYTKGPLTEEELERKVLVEMSHKQQVDTTPALAFKDDRMELTINKKRWNNLDLQDESLQGVTYVIEPQQTQAEKDKKDKKAARKEKSFSRKLGFGVKKKKDEFSISTPAHN